MKRFPLNKFGVVLFFLLSCSTHSKLADYYMLSEEQLQQQIDLTQIVRPDSVDISLLELAVFAETNRERERLGLKSLKYDHRLQIAAQQHSQEMVTLSYFEHNSPVPKNATVRKRMQRVGIRFGTAGENIAIHPSTRKQDVIFRQAELSAFSRYVWRNHGADYTYLKFAHDLVHRWLNSPPHRRNILDKNFKYLGVGCVQAAVNESDVYYVTQDFSSTNY